MSVVTIVASDDIDYANNASQWSAGTNTSAGAGVVSSGKGSNNMSLYVMFSDLSSIPSGALVTSAYIEAYCTSQTTSAITFNSYAAAGSWGTESSPTTNTGPTGSALKTWTANNMTTGGAYFNLVDDVKTLLNSWISSGGSTNHGIIVPYESANQSTVGQSFTINTRNAQSNPPHLVVTYTAVPNQPTGLTLANDATHPWVDVSWTAPSSGDTPTGYKVDRATNSSFTTGLVTTDVGNTTSWTDQTTSATSTTYWYRVRAYDAAGDGANTLGSSITTNSVLAPNTPTGLTIVLTQHGSSYSADLSWTASATDGTHDAPTNYKIDKATDPAFGTFSTIDSGSLNGNPKTSYSDSAVSPGVTYYYRVWASNGGGSSGVTATQSVTIPGGRPPVFVGPSAAVQRAGRW